MGRYIKGNNLIFNAVVLKILVEIALITVQNKQPVHPLALVSLTRVNHALINSGSSWSILCRSFTQLNAILSLSKRARGVPFILKRVHHGYKLTPTEEETII